MTILPFRIYGLVDCNSFFASCEKLFRPDLKNKAVVVLSNNDGIVIARSPEAKQLGIPMGETYFKIKRFVDRGQVIAFSSNYRLYGDMSGRVMQSLNQWTPSVEIYSIDEAFLDLSGLGYDLDSIDSLMNEIVTTVKKWTGIPVSLGVGSTMTLSKVANDIVKKGCGTGNLLDPQRRNDELGRLAVEEVWGIGRKLSPKMQRLGIRTAKDLASVDPLWMRKEFSVVLERLVRELNGECCIDLTQIPSPRKNIQVSRSFHDATDDYQTLVEAVSFFAAKACEKARSEGTVASAVYVHLNTSWFKDGYVSVGRARGFDIPTAHTPEVIKATLELLRGLYQSGPLYKKASVMLLELRDATAVQSQGLLFDLDAKTPEIREKEGRLMESFDQINQTFGTGKLFFGSQGIKRDWRSTSEHCSPNYTICWDELPVVKAK